MMDKQHILDEIRRTAALNGGSALGIGTFEKETGIKKTDWYGKFWSNWSNALHEAGLTPNKLQEAYKEEFLIKKFIDFLRELGRFPVNGDLLLKTRNDSAFPSPRTFNNRFGTKANLVMRLIEYCQEHDGFEDVMAICKALSQTNKEDDKASEDLTGDSVLAGFVYLLKAGKHYKIGRSNAINRRERELAIQLPERAEKVHVISTDDAAGIEEYWHRRFAKKRLNGEWFVLNTSDVKAFKRRKFM